MPKGFMIFKEDIGDLVVGETYYFREAPHKESLLPRRYIGKRDDVFIFVNDALVAKRGIVKFRLNKDGDHLNVVDTEPPPPGNYGPLSVKEHVKEQRGGKTRRATSGMQRCESAYCGKTFQQLSENFAVKMGKTFKMPKNAINTMIKTLRSKKGLKKAKKECMKAYCNPDCKDNLFQDGTSVPSVVYKSFKGPPKMKAFFKSFADDTRKKMFGKKTSVLKNSFYNKLPAKNVTRARKQGALSGCTIKILT